MNSNQSLNNQFNSRSKKFAIWFVVISTLGFFDALYLTISHYSGSGLNCFVLKGCDVVATSQYALMLGVPVALLGAIYYFFVLLTSIFSLDIQSEKVLLFLSRITVIGFLFSLWFLFAQIFLIHALCTYCLISFVTSTALFVMGMVFLRKK